MRVVNYAYKMPNGLVDVTTSYAVAHGGGNKIINTFLTETNFLTKDDESKYVKFRNAYREKIKSKFSKKS